MLQGGTPRLGFPVYLFLNSSGLLQQKSYHQNTLSLRGVAIIIENQGRENTFDTLARASLQLPILN